jgi:ribosomal protein L4
MKQMKTKSRQALWQEKQIAEKRCASCASQDKETLAGSRRCGKCKSKGRKHCRQAKRDELGCNPWVKGGRGRPPVNKREVSKERKEWQLKTI